MVFRDFRETVVSQTAHVDKRVETKSSSDPTVSALNTPSPRTACPWCPEWNSIYCL